MTSRTLTGIVVLILAAAVAGCNDSRTPTTPPPTPAPSPPPQPGPTQVLRGLVSDSAFRELAGVKVEVVDGPLAGMSTMSNATGSFSFPGTFDDTVTFRASKEGYVAATQTQQRNPTGSVWLSFTLSVLAAPVAIARDYTVTFTADSACAGNLPEGSRERTYAATISPSLYAGAPPQTQFNVTLTGAPFLAGYGSFYIGVAGDYVAIIFGGHGPLVVEQLGPNTYLALDGWTGVSVGTSSVSTISTPFEGSFEHCERRSAPGFYDCPSAQSVSKARCESKNHQLLLTRR